MMSAVRFQVAGRASPRSLCHIICLCTTWVQVVSAIPQAVRNDAQLPRSGGLGLIPSASVPVDLVPSAPLPTSVIPSQPPEVTPSQPPQSAQIPSSAPPIGLIPSVSAPPAIISSAHPPASNSGLFPSAPRTTDAIPSVHPSQGITSGTPQMTSTDQGLKPVPPAATQPGDPNGHHEVTEPNFTATKSCKGCSPVIEISATGWMDSPAEEQHGTTEAPPKATIPAGSTQIVVSQVASGGNFVIGGSTTLTPGQTITVDDTPIVIQTSAGKPVVVVGSTTIPLQPNEAAPQITDAPVPLPPTLTVGTQVLTPNAQTQYIIADQTLSPGGPALTVSGTVVSLAPSATALIINGATSTVTPNYGNVYTTQMPAAFDFHNQVYTANRAGYIVIGPGTTLIPGGVPITVDGTTLSLEHSGTAVVVQGTTSMLAPVTTIVTLTKSLGAGGYAGAPSGTGLARATDKPVSGGATPNLSFPVTDGWFAGVLMLLWWSLGSLAIRL